MATSRSPTWMTRTSSDELVQLHRLPWQGRAFDPSLGLFVADDKGHVAVWVEGRPQAL